MYRSLSLRGLKMGARLTLRSVVLGAAVVLTACSSGSVTDADLPDPGPADAYWSLTLQDHAINITDDTLDPAVNRVQLVAIPRDAKGVPLTGVTTRPVFNVLNPLSITVDTDGVLVGRKVGTGFRVAVEWQINNVTHMDTAYVNVTDTAPSLPLATFTYQPAPGDSAKWSYNAFDFVFGYKHVTARAFDANGGVIPVETIVDFTPVPGLRVEYKSSNSQLLPIDRFTGEIQANLMGDVKLIASTYAYGVRKADTVDFRIGLPLFGSTSLPKGGSRFTPDTLTMGVGAIVSFENYSEQPIAVLFPDPSLVSATFFFPEGGGGDIPAIATNEGALRQFNTPGLYTFRDAQGHELGTINVQSE